MIVLSHDPDTILVPSGENATDSISLLCAFNFSLSSSSLTARQASRRQFWPRRDHFEDSGAPESQTLIVLSHDPETIFVPSGESATDVISWLWAFVFSLNSSSLSAGDKRASEQASVLAKEGRFENSGAPISQTLIVPSADPDTILVPSGENATDMT